MSLIQSVQSRPADPQSVPAGRAGRRDNLAWLDGLKGIAILAVVFDHSFVVNDYVVWKHAYFAVSWFILLAGVSNTLSARHRSFRPRTQTVQFWRRRLQSMLGPYLWASIIAYAVLHGRDPSPVQFVRQLLLFHALPPFYFVALLFQFLLAFPLLYWLITRRGGWGIATALAGMVPVATLLAIRLTFPWVLGAHYFLGASFLYLFVIGMLLAPALVNSYLRAWMWALLAAPLVLWGESRLLATNGGIMTHPPSNMMLVYVTGLLLLCYALLRAFAGSLPARVAVYLGHRSLDIFLYHYLFLMPFLSLRYVRWDRHLSLEQCRWIVSIVAMPAAIAGALVLSHCSRWLWRQRHRLRAARPRRAHLPDRRSLHMVRAPFQSRS